MQITRIDHVQLAMPPGRESDAVDFYEALLEIPQVPKPPHLAGRGGCWFERGDLKIHLGVEPDFQPAQKAHPAFVVQGLAELLERLRANSVPVRAGEPLDGVDHAYVDDPFGNRIELLEPRR